MNAPVTPKGHLRWARKLLLEASEHVDEAMPTLQANGFAAMIDGLVLRIQHWIEDLEIEESNG